MKNLILIKLPNNQEIVGYLLSSDSYGIKLSHPRFISYISDGAGNFEASLLPYSPIHPDGEYVISTSAVLSTCTHQLPTILTDMFTSHTTGLQISTGLSK